MANGAVSEKALGLPVPSGAPRTSRTAASRGIWKLLTVLVVSLVVFRAYRSVTWPHHPRRRHLPPAERDRLFLSVPSTEHAQIASRVFSSQPHLAGSPQDFEDAKAMLRIFQSAFNIRPPHHPPIFKSGTPRSRHATLGLTHHRKPNAWIDVYYPVLNTPVSHSLELLDDNGVTLWSADLEEDGDEADPLAHKYRVAIPAWHGLSKDGIAEGQLVYANYGTKEDFDQLAATGTNLTGKIVLARYGQNFRGLKIQLAQEAGASGVLIYSDTRDDGLVTVENGYETYPHGPARNPTSVQRGSVQFLAKYPGDPTTPGYPAYENSTRAEGTNVPQIPSLPISWQNAQRLLAEVGDGFQLTGRASHSKLRLTNHVETKVTPIWNTMAAIPGYIRDEVVVIGNHRDAWIMGAADPTSGTATMNEIVRGYGELLKTGWKPLRTILFASWDAEEYGLVGSTEWGEDFPEWVSSHVVAYLNVDVSADGSRWNVNASPSLRDIIKKTASEIPHPTTEGRSLWDARLDVGPFVGLNTTEQVTTQVEDRDVGPLGSGSDYTVFLQRIGIASTDNGFGGTPSDAPYHYHSIYDSPLWMELYGDPGFHRQVAIARYLGVLGLRLADSLVLPLNTTRYAFELDNYLDKVEAIQTTVSKTFPALRKSIRNLQGVSVELDTEKEEAEKALLDAIHNLPHKDKCGKHHPAIRTMRTWIKRVFEVHEGHYTSWSNDGWRHFLGFIDAEHPKFPGKIKTLIEAIKKVHKVNKKLASFEKGFISEDGIKEREWYLHLGVAPGRYLGYGATTLPALTESLTIEKNITLAKYEENRLVQLLDTLVEQLKA